MNRNPGRLRRVRAALPKIADILTLLVLGGVAFLGSARHVFDLAEKHGQGGTAAWLIAGSVEVLAAYCGWRMRASDNRWERVVAGLVLCAAVAFVILANLATAEDSNWGRALAVAPAATFLAVVAIGETRLRTPQTEPEPAVFDPDPAPAVESVPDPAPTVAEQQPPAADEPTEPKPTPAPRPKAKRAATGSNAQRIAALRAEKPAITQVEAAAELGVSTKTVGRYWGGPMQVVKDSRAAS